MADEPTFADMMRKVAREHGNDPDRALDELEKMDMAYEMASEMFKNYLQRCQDIGLNPMHGMLIVYNSSRFQVKANMKRGAITRADLKGIQMAGELCRWLRHPDGEFPMLTLGDDGSFTKIGDTQRNLLGRMKW